MLGVLAASTAKLLFFQLIGGLLLVLGRGVILTLALGAIETNDHSHWVLPSSVTRGRTRRPAPLPSNNLNYSTISATTPAPTVRPPSRMAKRSSFSMAIGVI